MSIHISKYAKNRNCFLLFMETNEILHLIIDSKGWNQTQIAEKLGISQRSVSTYEAGRGVPSRKTRRKIEELAISLGVITKEPEIINNKNDICDEEQLTLAEQLIIYKTEARIFRELHKEHLETERQFIQKVEIVLTKFEGFINKDHKQGTHISPATRSHQVTGGL
jgi:transcriptional regulator with XRE-family HTH domain